MAPKKNKRGTRSPASQEKRIARGITKRLEQQKFRDQAAKVSCLPSGQRQFLVKKRKRRRTRRSRLVLTEGPGAANSSVAGSSAPATRRRSNKEESSGSGTAAGDTALSPSSWVAGGSAPATGTSTSTRRRSLPSLIQKLIKSNQVVEVAKGDWSKRSFRERPFLQGSLVGQLGKQSWHKEESPGRVWVFFSRPALLGKLNVSQSCKGNTSRLMRH